MNLRNTAVGCLTAAGRLVAFANLARHGREETKFRILRDTVEKNGGLSFKPWTAPSSETGK